MVDTREILEVVNQEPKELEPSPAVVHGEKPELSPNPNYEGLNLDNKGQATEEQVGQQPKETFPRYEKLGVGKLVVNNANDIIDPNGNPVIKDGVGEKVDASEIDSGSATSGKVLTADGSGGASWETPASEPTSNYYMHNVDVLYDTSKHCKFCVICTKAEPVTSDQQFSVFSNCLGFVANDGTGNSGIIISIFDNTYEGRDGFNIGFIMDDDGDSFVRVSVDAQAIVSITDTVKAL